MLRAVHIIHVSSLEITLIRSLIVVSPAEDPHALLPMRRWLELSGLSAFCAFYPALPPSGNVSGYLGLIKITNPTGQSPGERLGCHRALPNTNMMNRYIFPIARSAPSFKGRAIRFYQTAATPSAPKMDPRINQILGFWFGLSPKEWFQESTAELDDKVRAQFGSMVAEARSSKFDETWTATPQGTLALLILLDQFPRNIFRGSGESFASDKHAVTVATKAIAREFDQQITSAPGTNLFHRMFFYLPLMHAEDLTAQVACTALVDNLANACAADSPEKPMLDITPAFTRRHRDCIQKLGRFPKRNAWLGRESTDEEKKYLEEHQDGF